ncbi:MAG: hypothetical protein KJ052_03075 [Candidatus Hydrogenedentes bacterium]|nr:hypothetical protein [Candidatus Hydrogenedentota bacterium]
MTENFPVPIWSTDAQFNPAEFRNPFGGQLWRVTPLGIEVQGEHSIRRTVGAPVTARRILSLMHDPLLAAAARHRTPPALLIMTVATETGLYRRVNFTGPRTFRWEAHVQVSDVSPVRRGDYSAGPMQVLGGTAREMIRRYRLDLDAFETAPAYAQRPAPPSTHPLYGYAVSLDIGAAYIRHTWRHTHGDPILIAAAYNAGGVYRSERNVWRLRCHGDHLDRAAAWYGDACAVLEEAGVKNYFPDE